MGDTIQGNNDVWPNSGQPCRGVFGPDNLNAYNNPQWAHGTLRSIADIHDGTSNTVAFSEMCIYSGKPSMIKGGNAQVAGIDANPSLCYATKGINGAFALGATINTAYSSGMRWCDGRPMYAGFCTVLGQTPQAVCRTWPIPMTGTGGSSRHRAIIRAE